MSYYDRGEIDHLDGTKIFQTAADRDNEATVATIIEGKWNCNIRRFGVLSPIDWFAERNGRLVGVLEVKSRTHPSDKFPTVFLNVRKWLALRLASIGLGCPALFVVRFTDCVRWVAINDVDGTQNTIGGCSRIVKGISDIEPVIEVDIATMQILATEPHE